MEYYKTGQRIGGTESRGEREGRMAKEVPLVELEGGK